MLKSAIAILHLFSETRNAPDIKWHVPNGARTEMFHAFIHWIISKIMFRCGFKLPMFCFEMKSYYKAKWAALWLLVVNDSNQWTNVGFHWKLEADWGLNTCLRLIKLAQWEINFNESLLSHFIYQFENSSHGKPRNELQNAFDSGA